MDRRHFLMGAASVALWRRARAGLVPLGGSKAPFTPSANAGVIASASGLLTTSYATAFAATENPISEGSRWINGGATGIDWTNIQTTPGLAFATQTIHSHPPFDDSIAVLAGHWPADQWCQGTIHNASAHSREVELILRGSISGHSAVLYEIDITQSNGLDIAKWTGLLNGFVSIASPGMAAGVSLVDGAVWYAQIVGSTITVKCNGTTVYSGTDTDITTGSPGMGFYGDTEAGSPTANNTLGWSNYSAGQM